MAATLLARPVLRDEPRLTAEVVDDLRARFSREQDEQFALRVAVDVGWDEAERRYLRWQRVRGKVEMEALMHALGVERVGSPFNAARLVALAYELFMPAEDYGESAVWLPDDRLRIVASDAGRGLGGWQALASRGTWLRRQGWYEALGVKADEWAPAGPDFIEPACVAEVSFSVGIESPQRS